MKNPATPLKNILLASISVLLVLLTVWIGDRVLGAVLSPPNLPDTMELIFPPLSEQHYETVDFSYSAYINSLGLRDRELTRERGNGYRILAIGDSYTYGWGVNIEESWVRLLHEQLVKEDPPMEVINCGKPGAGPPYYAELAEKIIPILRPNLVIVGILQGNDLRAAGPEEIADPVRTFWDWVRMAFPNSTRWMRDMRREREHAERTHLDLPKQISTAEDNRRWTENTAKDFLEKMPPEHRARFDAFDDKVRAAFLNGMLNPYMIDLAMQNPDFYILTLDPEDSWTQTCIARAASQFKRIKRAAEEYGSKVLVVCIPEGPYVNRHALQNMARVGYNMPEWLLTTQDMDTPVREACKLADIPFVEVTQAFREHQEDPNLYFELDGHPTALGNKLFAEAFLPKLLDFLGK